jgi:hypothetical protein
MDLEEIIEVDIKNRVSSSCSMHFTMHIGLGSCILPAILSITLHAVVFVYAGPKGRAWDKDGNSH